MNYPRAGIYCSLRSSGANLIRPDGAIDTANVAALARWQDVILELGCGNHQPRAIEALRTARPDIRLHGYVVLHVWPSGVPFFRDFHALVVKHDAWNWLTNGSIWSFMNFNLARLAAVDELADLILAHVPGWDGLFLDLAIPRLSPASHRPGSDGVMDWRRMGFGSEAGFLETWERGAKLLVDRCRAQGPVVTNYGVGFARANGHTVEKFPGTNNETWEQTLKAALDAPHEEPRANWFCSEPVGTWENGVRRFDPKHPENVRQRDYHDASACLVGGFGTFGRYEFDDVWCRDRYAFYSPNYRHPQLGEGWLGEPGMPALHVTDSGGPQPKPVDLWMRNFERGLVIVNPSAASHSIYFHDRYKPIGGAVKSAFSLPPKSGLLLERMG